MYRQNSNTVMVPLSPLVRLRIARRCLVMSWRESEHLQPFVVAAAILIVLLVPMVVLVWKAVQE